MIHSVSSPICDYRVGDLLYAVDEPLPRIEPGVVTAREASLVCRDHLALHGFRGRFVGRNDDSVCILSDAGERRWYPLACILARCRHGE